LHTGDLDDPDYYIARRVLRALCKRFDSVYTALCATTQNLIAICHQGDFLQLDEWSSQLNGQLERPEVAAVCKGFSLDATMSRFDFVGGKEEPMSDEDAEAASRLGL
jgi:hypothetical protein